MSVFHLSIIEYHDRFSLEPVLDQRDPYFSPWVFEGNSDETKANSIKLWLQPLHVLCVNVYVSVKINLNFKYFKKSINKIKRH